MSSCIFIFKPFFNQVSFQDHTGCTKNSNRASIQCQEMLIATRLPSCSLSSTSPWYTWLWSSSLLWWAVVLLVFLLWTNWYQKQNTKKPLRVPINKTYKVFENDSIRIFIFCHWLNVIMICCQWKVFYVLIHFYFEYHQIFIDIQLYFAFIDIYHNLVMFWFINEVKNIDSFTDDRCH